MIGEKISERVAKTKILLIDNGTMLPSVFEDDILHKYNFTQAMDFSEARYFLFSGLKVDVIIIDAAKQEYEAFDFIRDIKQHPSMAKVCTILFTDRTNAKELEIQMNLGVNRLYMKPYEGYLTGRMIDYFIEREFAKQIRMQNRLISMRERLDAIETHVPCAICLYEMHGQMRLIQFNPFLESLLGYTRDELMRTDFKRLEAIVHPEDYAMMTMGIYQGINKHRFPSMKVRLRRRDGNYFWIQLLANACTIQNEEYIQAILLPIDEHQENLTILENKVRTLENKLNVDPLTGIYTREHFCDRALELIASDPHTRRVIIIIDIDNFSGINEFHGNDIGDKVLQATAQALAMSGAGLEVWGRLEADRFAVCMTLDQFTTNLITMEQFLDGDVVQVNEVRPMMHMGVYRVEDGESNVGLMCDRGIYAVRTIKNNFMKRWIYYEHQFSLVLDEQEILNDMQSALDNHEFFVVVQPIVDAVTRKIVSGETLVRWQHAKKGVISPGVFIPLFEKNGFITKLDRFMVEEVCKFLSDQKKKGKRLVPVSVNLSRTDFYDTGLCNLILDLAGKYDVDPKYIKLEITESIYENNQSALHKVIKDFRDNGFCVLMDDFGSGYSSLNMLKDTDIDILKIDMKFMEDLENSNRANNILYSIVQMAKSLNIQIVVEGVENQIQYELVKNMGCECIQGYYFYRPMRTEQFSALLEAESEDNSEMIHHSRGVMALIICNDQEMSLSIRKALGTQYHIIERNSAEDALAYLKRYSDMIDIIFSAIDLPGENGVELLGQMQRYSHLKHIPVVMMTTKTKKEHIQECIRLGAMDVIVMPFDSETFLRYVENLLRVTKHSSVNDEVYHMRERLNLNQEVLSLVNQQSIGLCRLMIQCIDTATGRFDPKLIKTLVTTECFERMHDLDDDKLRRATKLADIFRGPGDESLDKVCERIERLLASHTENCQLYYKITYAERIETVLTNITIRYDGNQAILDCAEMLKYSNRIVHRVDEEAKEN